MPFRCCGVPALLRSPRHLRVRSDPESSATLMPAIQAALCRIRRPPPHPGPRPARTARLPARSPPARPSTPGSGSGPVGRGSRSRAQAPNRRRGTGAPGERTTPGGEGGRRRERGRRRRRGSGGSRLGGSCGFQQPGAPRSELRRSPDLRVEIGASAEPRSRRSRSPEGPPRPRRPCSACSAAN